MPGPWFLMPSCQCRTLTQKFFHSKLRLQYICICVQRRFRLTVVSISTESQEMKWRWDEVAEHSGFKQSAYCTLIQTVSLPTCKSWNLILFSMYAWKHGYECRCNMWFCCISKICGRDLKTCCLLIRGTQFMNQIIWIIIFLSCVAFQTFCHNKIQ